MSSRRIFISYSHADYAFVESVSTSQSEPEDIIWLDRKVIQPGDVWRDQIHKALKKSYCLIFFASPVSVKSDEVKKELGYALHLKKRVIPVIIADCELPYEVVNLHHINIADKSQESVKIFRDVITGISKKKGKDKPQNETAAAIVKDVKDSNSFYNTVIAPNRFIWTSSLASITLMLFLATYFFSTRSVKPAINVISQLDTLSNGGEGITNVDSVASKLDTVLIPPPESRDFIAKEVNSGREDSIKKITKIKQRPFIPITPTTPPAHPNANTNVDSSSIKDDNHPNTQESIAFTHIGNVIIFNADKNVISVKSPNIKNENGIISVNMNLNTDGKVRKKHLKDITINFDEKYAHAGRLYPGQFFLYTDSGTTFINNRKLQVAYIDISDHNMKIVLDKKSSLLSNK